MLLIDTPPSLSEVRFFAPPLFHSHPGNKRPRLIQKNSVRLFEFKFPPQTPKFPPVAGERKEEETPSKKRKRGYFPYTEDPDYDSFEDSQPVRRPSSVPHKRIFHDYVPWYRWGRPSFVLPHERARGFKCPDTDSEPDIETKEPKKAVDTVVIEPPPISPKPAYNTSTASTIETQLAIPCSECKSIKDPKIPRKAQRLAKPRPAYGIEKLFIDGIFMIHDCAAWLLGNLGELKSGILHGYRTLATAFRRRSWDSEPPRKRQKTTNGVAIIPQGARWPPTKALVRLEQHPPGSAAGRTIKTKTPLAIKRYLNAQFDEYIAKQAELGHCVCKCQRRTLTFISS